MAQSGTIVPGIDVQPAGPRLFDPEPATDGVAKGRGKDSQHSVVAATTQTQAAAAATAQLINGLNVIETCANASDGVALPLSKPGTVVPIFNSGAQAPTVFSHPADPATPTINGTAGATGVTGPASGKMAFAVCAENGKWNLSVTG